MDKVHFKGLNGIRAIACLIVIVFHIDENLNLFGLTQLGYHKTGMAGYGVILFFVLSGFLITYLMLIEKQKFKRVDLIKFYKRRILRIWPIYYLVIIIAALLLIFKIIAPSIAVYKTFILYSVLASNIAYGGLGLGLITITPLWSVGVEEQFYLFWPILLNNSRKFLRTLIIIITVYLGLKIFLKIFEHGPLYNLIGISAFDSMAIGGIFAYFIFTQNGILKFLYHPLLQVISWVFLLVSVFFKPIHLVSLFDTELHSVIYGILIINVSTNPNALVKLENRFLNFIGKISYGMYVYHMTVIVLLSYFIKNLIHFPENTYLQYSMVYILVVGLTVILSYLSYNYFESIFSRIKLKYANVPSTNEISANSIK